MMLIKVIKKDDEILTRINGSFEDIARYYFPDQEVEKIEILEAETVENEYYKKTFLEIFRASDDDIDNFDLWYNIRLSYRVDYKTDQTPFSNYQISSCGLCQVL